MPNWEIDVEAKDDLVVEGYAAVTNSPTVLCTDIHGYEYREIISPTAFDGADTSDVIFIYNHDQDALPVARTRNDTLEINFDEKGMHIRAKLADTTAGRDLYQLVKRGDIDKMSFAFTVADDHYEEDGTGETRHIDKIDKIVDVSAVPFPAYDETTLEARSKDRMMRKMLILKTYF